MRHLPSLQKKPSIRMIWKFVKIGVLLLDCPLAMRLPGLYFGSFDKLDHCYIPFATGCSMRMIQIIWRKNWGIRQRLRDAVNNRVPKC